MRTFRIFTLLSSALWIAPALIAQPAAVDLNGTWNLQTSITLADETVPCELQGLSHITQTGSAIAGTSELMLISGPAGCPAEMTASLNGVVTNAASLTVAGTLSGPIGGAAFAGVLSPNPGGGGPFEVTQGPFVGQSGTWSAALLESAIPFLTPIGLMLLVLTVLGTGIWLLRGQAPA